MPPRPRLSPEEVELMMVPRIVEALYPVLIPIEQQDCAIQAANHTKITTIAQVVWRQFVGDVKGAPDHG
jgi:hypothetical protein